MREINPRSPAALFLLAVVVIYAALLVGAPLVSIVQSAFSAGLQPIIETLRTPSVIHAFAVSIPLSLGAVVINTIAGLITAWVLVRHRFRGKQLFDLMVDIPFVFSPVIAGYALIVLFGRGGWLAPTIIPIAFALPGILLAKTFVSLPFVTREVQPVLTAVTPEQEEAAYITGANRWVTFWRVIMPEIWPGVLYGVVLTFARAIGEFGAVAVVGGNIEGRTETATSFIFRALNDRNDTGAYSVSIVLCGISLIVLLLMSLLKRRILVRS
jgi:sulfate transport system permease protein